MVRWICPECEREFAKERQAHVCVPGNTVEKSFAKRPEQREIYDAVIEHLRELGPVHEDAVSVGVFLKHRTKFVEVRPMARALSLAIVLPRIIQDPRIARSERISAHRVVIMVRLKTVEDLDDTVKAWLTESYLSDR